MSSLSFSSGWEYLFLFNSRGLGVRYSVHITLYCSPSSVPALLKSAFLKKWNEHIRYEVYFSCIVFAPDKLHFDAKNVNLQSCSAVLWIRIGFNADPDPGFFVNADPDPNPRFL